MKHFYGLKPKDRTPGELLISGDSNAEYSAGGQHIVQEEHHTGERAYHEFMDTHYDNSNDETRRNVVATYINLKLIYRNIRVPVYDLLKTAPMTNQLEQITYLCIDAVIELWLPVGLFHHIVIELNKRVEYYIKLHQEQINKSTNRTDVTGLVYQMDKSKKSAAALIKSKSRKLEAPGSLYPHSN